MDSLSLLVLLIFSSNSRGELLYDQYDYFEYGDGNAGISEDFITLDSGNVRRGQPDEYTTSSSEMTTRPELSSAGNDHAGQEDIPTRLEEDFGASDERLPTTLAQPSKVPSFGVNSKITYAHSYQKNLRANETNLDQAPRRRDLNNWKESDGLFETNDHNPRGGSPEFYDDASYLPEKYASQVDGKPLQHHQKNYYYNYHPQVNGRKFVAPSESEIYKSERRNIKGDGTGPYKFRKISPCRQYLEFLRYAFQKLDRSSDYQYDYNEYIDEWREPEPQRYHDLFGTRLYGPTLYIDNSGKAYQVNSNGLSVEDRVFPVSKDAIILNGGAKQYPTTPYYQDRTNEIDFQRFFGTTIFYNPNWNNIGYTKSGFSTQTKPSDGPGTPATFSTKVGDPSFQQSDEMKDYQNWWNTLRTDSYPTTHPMPYNLEDSAEGETKVFDDYDFSVRPSLPTTTAHPIYNSTDYYSGLGNLREQSDNTMQTLNSSLFYWTSPDTQSDKTTLLTIFSKILPTSPPLNTFSSKTIIEVETPEREGAKEADCNDKMLPCPDTVNITYPLNGYCNRYVSCESGRAIRKTCPDGLHFNIIIKNCDIPHNSFCTYSCPEPDGYFGIPGDCSGYFVCKNSVPEYRMCPPRMHWEPHISRCTFAELSRCPMKCDRANEVKHYEGDCKAYVVCLNSFPFYHKCPPNTKFDVKSLSCVPEKMSKCEDDPKLLTKTLNPSLLCKDIDIKNVELVRRCPRVRRTNGLVEEWRSDQDADLTHPSAQK